MNDPNVWLGLFAALALTIGIWSTITNRKDRP